MTRSSATPFALLLGAITVAACGGDGGEWQGTVRDSAGVEIVSNTGAGAWGPADAWTVREELDIGTAEGEAVYQFGQITGLDVGDDGRVYVADQQAREIRVFSPEGEYQQTLGQPGGGPGELSQALSQVFVGPGDTVLVPDVGHQRITRYSPAGDPLESVPLPLTEGIPAKWMESADDALIQQAMVMQLPGQEDVEPKNLLLRRNRAGEVVDTLMEMPIGKSVSFAGGQPSFRIFEAEPMWTLGPDGRVYSGINHEYRIAVRSPEGELVRIVEKPTERKPVTEGDQAELRRVFRGLWERNLPPQTVEMMMQRLEFADYYPAYANLMGGPYGTLWVQGVQTPESVAEEGVTFDIQDFGGPDWEVFDRDGRLLGVVRMPPRFTPVLFHGDAIYGVRRDDLDVQHVVRVGIDSGTGTPDAG